MATATQYIRLQPETTGHALGRIESNPEGALNICNELLQKNHEKWHMYFRDIAGHNHIPHALLTTLAMGGGPKELQRAYDDGEPIQRALPAVDLEVVDELSDPAKFRARMNLLPEYSNFLVFFKREIAAKGWQNVFNEYCFSRTPLAEYMLAQLYEGLYHPIIHVGFGVEFDLPDIVAEGLAHAASHDPGDIDIFFQRSEELANSGTVSPKPLIELYNQVRASDKIRTATRLSDGAFRVRDGVLGRALEEIVAVAAQFQVTPETLERATAEMISCAAYTSGAAQKPGKARRIDFFIMHNVTCSIFFTVFIRQPWLRIEDKIRLVEWKARLDLVWYASCACPELRPQDIHEYKPTLSEGLDWATMYSALNKLHDDGHVAKFVRALKNGEDVAKPYETGAGSEDFPAKGDMWFKIAQMCFDTTSTNNTKVEEKWVWGAGFDPMWAKFPDFIVAKAT